MTLCTDQLNITCRYCVVLSSYEVPDMLDERKMEMNADVMDAMFTEHKHDRDMLEQVSCRSVSSPFSFKVALLNFVYRRR